MDAVETIEREANTMDDIARLKYHLGRVSATIADLQPIRERAIPITSRHIAIAITELENVELRLGRAIKTLEG